MIVESKNSIASIVSVYQPMIRKPKPIMTCTRHFPPALSMLHGIATNLDWFTGLFAPTVICQSDYFGICFMTLDN